MRRLIIYLHAGPRCNALRFPLDHCERHVGRVGHRCSVDQEPLPLGMVFPSAIYVYITDPLVRYDSTARIDKPSS
jgi:hypothetical protein